MIYRITRHRDVASRMVKEPVGSIIPRHALITVPAFGLVIGNRDRCMSGLATRFVAVP